MKKNQRTLERGCNVPTETLMIMQTPLVCQPFQPS